MTIKADLNLSHTHVPTPVVPAVTESFLESILSQSIANVNGISK